MMSNDGRLLYQVPRVMRLGDVFTGPGACDPSGSGDAECMAGSGALDWCDLGNFGGERP